MAKKPEQPEQQTAALDGEQLEIIERFDAREQAEIDGDPCYEAKLVDESIPSDVVPVWAHESDVRAYKGRAWREVKAGEEGIEMLCGAEFAKGETMTFRDHTLMVRDRGRHEKILAAERSRNRATRGHFLKTANAPVFVNNPGDGPRQMARR